MPARLCGQRIRSPAFNFSGIYLGNMIPPSANIVAAIGAYAVATGIEIASHALCIGKSNKIKKPKNSEKKCPTSP